MFVSRAVVLSSILSLSLGFAGNGLAADELKSGPQVGQRTGKFLAGFVNGRHANQERCPV